MAANCPPIKIQQFDDNGDLAVGYKLYTYVTGTTTPKTTYTDAAGTTPNANPIVLDARGEATVFLINGEQYRFVLKTAADVTKWTQDGVSATTLLVGDGLTLSNGVLELDESTLPGQGLSLLAGVLTVGSGTGMSVDASNVNIDEASAANAYGFANSAKVMTTRRMRDIFYIAYINNVSTTPAFETRSDSASAWTVSKDSTGVYTITHNLALTNVLGLIVVPAIRAGTDGMIQSDNHGTNSFKIRTYSDAGAAEDQNFNFIAARVVA